MKFSFDRTPVSKMCMVVPCTQNHHTCAHHQPMCTQQHHKCAHHGLVCTQHQLGEAARALPDKRAANFGGAERGGRRRDKNIFPSVAACHTALSYFLPQSPDCKDFKQFSPPCKQRRLQDSKTVIFRHQISVAWC